MNKVKLWPYVVTGVLGFAIYMAICSISGRREAWDDASYYYMGMPILFGIAFYAGYRFPQRSWHWPLMLAFGQSFAAAVKGSSLSVWPLAIIFVLVISIPNFIASKIGSRISQRSRT